MNFVTPYLSLPNAMPINAVLKNLHDCMPIFWLAFGQLPLLLLAVVVVVVVVVSLPL
jgi:hypothetical protein